MMDHHCAKCGDDFVNGVTDRLPGFTALLRLLLVAALWDAPIAWGHMHALQAGNLVSHTLVYHGGHNEVDAFQWHWHFSFLPFEVPELPQDHDDDPEHRLQRGDKRKNSASGSHLFSFQQLVDLNRHGLSSLGRSHTLRVPVQNEAFLVSISDKHGSQVVFCSWNC